jgi:phage gp36-like protein
MYATRQDMVTIYGESEIIKLTDFDRTGWINDAVLHSALKRASSQIDSYIGSRYAVPLSADIVPDDLTDKCCIIAHYKLSGGHNRQLTERSRADYEDALLWLRDVAKGIIKLGAGDTGAPRTASGIKFQSHARKFSRNATDGGGF